jgi:hypothetical protein
MSASRWPRAGRRWIGVGNAEPYVFHVVHDNVVDSTGETASLGPNIRGTHTNHNKMPPISDPALRSDSCVVNIDAESVVMFVSKFKNEEGKNCPVRCPLAIHRLNPKPKTNKESRPPISNITPIKRKPQLQPILHLPQFLPLFRPRPRARQEQPALPT